MGMETTRHDALTGTGEVPTNMAATVANMEAGALRSAASLEEAS